MDLSDPHVAERRARALDYPYRPAADDYLFTSGDARPWQKALDLRHRTPVIAAGSNRAPAQLRRKFGDAATVPVSRAWLADHDVVYSAHVARYGAIPACLFPAPDTRVAVWITWLDDTQLARMHETEAVGVAYDYAHIDAALADGRGVASVESLGFYRSQRGALADRGRPLALSAIAAENRQLAAAAQGEILDRLHQRHGHGAFDAWLDQLTQNADLRHQVTTALAADAIPWPD